MILTYGNYAHLPGECAVAINRRTAFSDTGIPYRETVQWTIEGRVEADTPAGVWAELARLEAAYRVPNRAARLVHADGFVAHQLLPLGSLSGVKVVQPPSFPNGTGAEYSTFRNYQIVLEAEYPVGNPNTLLRSWTETLTFRGGGPDRRLVETVDGPPVEYLAKRRTVFRCTQSGTAVGFLAYPPPAAVARPLFPAALEGAEHPVTYGSPRSDGPRLVDWPISWSYSFASAVPFVGLPRTIFTAGGG